MVRIISGRARGRKLQVPEGAVVRPTSDRVREALFNILVHRHHVPLAGTRVLDLFGGAGTLGLEALSRGAEEVWFVEQDAAVARVLASNLKALGGNTRLVNQPVAQFLTGPVRSAGQPPSAVRKSPFGLVFLDPPYHIGAVAPTLAALVDGWLTPAAWVVIEHPSDEVVVPPEPLGIQDQRIYGGTTVTLLARAIPADGGGR